MHTIKNMLNSNVLVYLLKVKILLISSCIEFRYKMYQIYH